MTREKAKQLLPVISAYAEGKSIQIITTRGWEDAEHPMVFDSHPSVYRIKPESVKGWVNIYPNKGQGEVCSAIHKSKEAADIEATDKRIACVPIEFTPE